MFDALAAVRLLLDLGRRRRPDDLPAALTAAAPHLAARDVTVLLVDYEQEALRSLGSGPPVPVDGTAAGAAFTTGVAQREQVPGGMCLWLPLLHGAERLGVLAVLSDADPDPDLRVIASLVAELIASRRGYSDLVERTRRREPMQLAAEIVWSQLPPLSYAAGGAVVTAVLEPCYDVGGDAFDYAANGDVLHLALFDTVGHGISASALATLTLNTYRNARRCGLDLLDTYRSIDKWIRARHPGKFVTAVLAELDTSTGTYRRINAGHPAELLLRGDTATPVKPAPTALPIGLSTFLPREPEISEVRLEPGDAVILYTDGITEARTAGGEEFGHDRLAALLTGEPARGASPAETMRRLVRAVAAHQEGELRDDATAALLRWHG